MAKSAVERENMMLAYKRVVANDDFGLMISDLGFQSPIHNLQAGMMEDGVVSVRTEGTSQGGPLSPLLSNILFGDLDKERKRRGHSFCRYADDCNIYVRSRRSGERVLRSITRLLEKKLRLKVNASKSAVGRPWQRSFLGYSMTREREVRLTIAPEEHSTVPREVADALSPGPRLFAEDADWEAEALGSRLL